MDDRQRRIRISKTLGRILRHSAVEDGLAIRSDGFVRMHDLLRHPGLKKLRVDEPLIDKIVDGDEKGRFETCDFEGDRFIRAAQGHSIATGLDDDSMLVRLDPTADDVPPIAIHGTYCRALPSIREQGLSRMNRRHIHMAAHEHARSGMRHNADMYIFIDVKRAMDAGIPFFRSSNGVILSPGNSEGLIPPVFFDRMEHATRRAGPQRSEKHPTLSRPP